MSFFRARLQIKKRFRENAKSAAENVPRPKALVENPQKAEIRERERDAPDPPPKNGFWAIISGRRRAEKPAHDTLPKRRTRLFPRFRQRERNTAVVAARQHLANPCEKPAHQEECGAVPATSKYARLAESPPSRSRKRHTAENFSASAPEISFSIAASVSKSFFKNASARQSAM